MAQTALVSAKARQALAEICEARWFAVQCQPHRENAAAEHLRRQHYAVFLPRQRKTVRHARRMDTVLRPFFPGYLFVRLDRTQDAWRPINSTFGVARLVMHGERPAPAPVGLVEGLVALCDRDGVCAWQSELVEGQRVRVSKGPFTDFCGELERLDGRGRVRVLLDVMGSCVPAMFERAALVPEDSLI